MAINRSVGQQPVSVADAQLARVAGEGSARHAYLNALLEASGRHSGRDLADAVHLLCNLYGRYPGLIEIALQRCPKGPAQEWLARASDAFERERLYLVRLTSAVGPLPSTPGAAETEASLVAARHALERWPCRSATVARSAPPPPSSATGGRSAACSTAPRPAPGSNRLRLASRRSFGPGGYRAAAPNSRERARPGLRRRATAAAASRACSTCSKRARKPAATIKRRWRSHSLCSFAAPTARPFPQLLTFALREQQPRHEHGRAQHEIGADGRSSGSTARRRRTGRAGARD